MEIGQTESTQHGGLHEPIDEFAAAHDVPWAPVPGRVCFNGCIADATEVEAAARVPAMGAP